MRGWRNALRRASVLDRTTRTGVRYAGVVAGTVAAEAEHLLPEGDDLDFGRWLPYGERELRVRDLDEESEVVEVGPGDRVLA